MFHLYRVDQITMPWSIHVSCRRLGRKGERTVNLVTGFNEVNGDDGFVQLKMRMTLRRKSLRLPGGCSLELAALKIEFPIAGFQRGLAAGFGFKKGPQHDIRSGEFEERNHTKSSLVCFGGGKRSPTLPGAEDRALVPG